MTRLGAAVERGIELGLAGRHELAVTAFDAALEAAPSCPAALMGRGLALHGAGRTLEALRSLRAAAELAPGTAGAWWNLGVVLHELGQRESAELLFAKAEALGQSARSEPVVEAPAVDEVATPPEAAAEDEAPEAAAADEASEGADEGPEAVAEEEAPAAVAEDEAPEAAAEEAPADPVPQAAAEAPEPDAAVPVAEVDAPQESAEEVAVEALLVEDLPAIGPFDDRPDSLADRIVDVMALRGLAPPPPPEEPESLEVYELSAVEPDDEGDELAAMVDALADREVVRRKLANIKERRQSGPLPDLTYLLSDLAPEPVDPTEAPPETGLVARLTPLVEADWSGALRLVSPEGVGEIELAAGRFVGARSSDTQRLGERLVAAGLVEADYIDDCLARQMGDRPLRLARLLADAGDADLQEMRLCLRARFVDAVAAMACWEDVEVLPDDGASTWGLATDVAVPGLELLADVRERVEPT